MARVACETERIARQLNAPKPGHYRVINTPRCLAIASTRFAVLWRRNGKFKAGIMVEDDAGRKSVRRVSLDASTGAEAQKVFRELMVERSENRLRQIGLGESSRIKARAFSITMEKWRSGIDVKHKRVGSNAGSFLAVRWKARHLSWSVKDFLICYTPVGGGLATETCNFYIWWDDVWHSF